MIRRAARQEPSHDELAAAQQVVDLFATEALLALDRYEQSFPADAPDKARRLADRLAHWWQRLELDDVLLHRPDSDAEQILVKAAELSLDPDNDRGVSVEEASAQAINAAAIAGRPLPAKSIQDFRKEFADAYGGRAQEPDWDDTWLAESLVRLRRASVLRDVVAAGSRVRVSAPLREAADDLVRQGQRLMDSRMALARRQEEPVSRREPLLRSARDAAALLAWDVTVNLTGAPLWADVALKAPALAVYVKSVTDAWRDHDHSVATRLHPAQAQLRAVRKNLTDTLDTQSPASRRD
ncbi:MAG: hypothetical protein HOV67_34780, partial [Kribbellaceae bacterium]|nr:hypothetical protein [Kribbellaceae bacterium]